MSANLFDIEKNGDRERYGPANLANNAHARRLAA